jgi:Macrocin-O-methyltransferase (TylF)
MTRRKRSVIYLTNKGLQLDLSAHALSKLLARYEIFKRVLDLPGDFVDCGVYRGASLFTWANLIEIFAPHSQKVVIGFDTFTGFAEDLHLDEDKEHAIRLMEDHERFVPRSCDELTTIAKSLGLAHRLRLVPGDAVKTIPEFVADNRGLRLSLLHLDFDVYEPTKAALEHLYPLLVPGGVVVLDEYGTSGWGESDAVDAFFAGQDISLQRFGWSPGPAAYFVKRTIG